MMHNDLARMNKEYITDHLKRECTSMDYSWMEVDETDVIQDYLN